MNEKDFDALNDVSRSDGAAAAIARLIVMLREQQEYHRLFDALLLQKKFEIGAPLARPTSLDDVPDDRRDEFEAAYVDAAREVGQLLLESGGISQAWVYFRTIQEPEWIRKAIDDIGPEHELNEQTEELIQIALYEGAHPVKGLEMLLHTHGTCNTITALDQSLAQLGDEQRRQAAELLVNTLYEHLSHTLLSEVRQRIPSIQPDSSIRELIAGRDWLFEDGNYHIDVSHLSSVVRFARALDASSPAMDKAIELAEYGSRLADQFQYPGDPPFDEFYPAHMWFFNVLTGHDREAGLDWFRAKLDGDPGTEDKRMVAYVIVDLLVRVEDFDRALELAKEYLTDIDESGGFAFSELCRKANRLDTLQDVARQTGDAVTYTAALVDATAAGVSESGG